MFRRATFGLTFALLSVLAPAQYIAVNLRPTTIDNRASGCTAAVVGQQAGFAMDPVGFRQYALIWSGTPESAVILTPDDIRTAGVLATDGVHQVGFYQPNFEAGAACMWSGTKESFVDLNTFPSNQDSRALGLYGPDQVGYAYVPDIPNGTTFIYAMMWHGSKDSYTILSTRGYAYGAGPGQQVGFRIEDGDPAGGCAALWRGTPESFVNLQPAGWTSTIAYATDGVHQVGYGTTPAGDMADALIWQGTASSFVDLGPGIAVAVANGKQCGYTSTPNGPHAAVWSGSAASYVDLSQFLPAGMYFSSEALGIDDNGDIVGDATRIDGNTDAIMWKPGITYSFSFFQQPLNDPASPESVVKKNSTLPVKFNLKTMSGQGAAGQVVTISLTYLGSTEEPVNESDFEAPSDSGNTFRDSGGGSYIYNLSTKSLIAGARYRVTATLANGQTHSATFAVR